jgi:phosphoglycolate phosphatase/AHBA synthesis associated protein
VLKQLARFQAFIFDLDGVLVDSYECWRALVNDMLKVRGRPPLSREEFDPTWGQGPEADREMFFPDLSLQQLLDYYNENFQKYTPLVKKEPGAADALRALNEKGKLIAVASNSTTPVIEELLKAADLLWYVGMITGAEEVEHSKPAPDLIYKTLRKLQVDVTQACYFGDSVFDDEAAKAAGIFFVGFKRPGQISINAFSELGVFGA